MGVVQSYLRKWEKIVNFGNSIAEILTKVWERRGKSKREKILNFGNLITEIPVAQSCCPSECEVPEVLVLGGVLKGKPIVAMALSK